MAKNPPELDAKNKENRAMLQIGVNMDDLYVDRDQYVLNLITKDEYIFKRRT